jgi:hypothetical protein
MQVVVLASECPNVYRDAAYYGRARQRGDDIGQGKPRIDLANERNQRHIT